MILLLLQFVYTIPIIITFPLQGKCDIVVTTIRLHYYYYYYPIPLKGDGILLLYGLRVHYSSSFPCSKTMVISRSVLMISQ